MMLSTTSDSVRIWNGDPLLSSCFIDGRWVEGAAGELTDVLNPANERSLARVKAASPAQAAQAVIAARRAFDEGPWRGVSAADRGRLLHRLCDHFEANLQEFIDLVILETGSPLPLARAGQVQTALDVLLWFADMARTGPPGGYERGLPLQYGPVTTASFLRQEPAGVVAAITAYNYPLLLLARKLGGVLASGCTTVVLPSERAPLATWRFFHLLEEVGYPPGVANLLIGGKDVGLALTTDPQVDIVTFTGSVAVGRDVMRQAAATTKRVLLELGGKSPTIVLPGADLDACVGPSILRFTVAAGQGCGCTTRTLVSKDDYEAYADAARGFVNGLRVTDPRLESTDVGPLIRSEHRDRVEGYVGRALNQGASIIAGGGRPDEPVGYYMNPTLIGDIGNASEIATSELFGPVGVLMPYGTVDEAIAIANDSRFGLHASVYGSTSAAMEVARRLSAGTVTINGGGGPRPDTPWGGYRDSGIGREQGDDGFREFFEVKHIQWPI